MLENILLMGMFVFLINNQITKPHSLSHILSTDVSVKLNEHIFKLIKTIRLPLVCIDPLRKTAGIINS